MIFEIFLQKIISQNILVARITRHVKNHLKQSYALIEQKYYKYFLLRQIAALILMFKFKTKILLVRDRRFEANDNGEFLFRYINNLRKKGIKSYFLLDERSHEYGRLKTIGNVIPLYSFRHYLYFICADGIASSHYVWEAFIGDNRILSYYFADLMSL